MTDETFAKGFAWVARPRLRAATGVRVGFTLDALPPEHSASVQAEPDADRTAARPADSAVLAIQPFIPEVFRGLATGLCRDPGSNCDARDRLAGNSRELIAWKRDYISAWVNTGVPVILDVSSGYDAHRVFGADNPPRYGNNEPWRLGQEQMLNSLGVRGITGNAWNGYTEALAFVPSCTAGPPGLPFCGTDAVFTEGRKAFDWFRRLTPAGGTERQAAGQAHADESRHGGLLRSGDSSSSSWRRSISIRRSSVIRRFERRSAVESFACAWARSRCRSPPTRVAWRLQRS